MKSAMSALLNGLISKARLRLAGGMYSFEERMYLCVLFLSVHSLGIA